jgi:hypothetical protein
MDVFFNNFDHLLPWVLLLTAYLALSFHAELTNRRVFILASLTLLVVFAGLRQPFTPDAGRYRSMYQDPDLLNATMIEPSFILISKGLNALGFDYHALFLVYTAITLTFIYAGIDNLTRHIRLALFLYISIPACFLNLFGEMRQVCAIAIAFYATSILLKKETRHRTLKVFAWAIVSIFFHYSAFLYWMILLCLYKLARKSYPALLYVAAMGISVAIPTSAVISVFMFLMSPFMPPKLESILDAFLRSTSSMAEAGQLLKSAIYVAMGLFFVLRLRRHEDDPKFRVLVNLFVLGVIILNLARGFAVASRLAYYFLIYQIVLFPEILDEVRERARSLLAGYTLVLFYLGEFLWGLFFFSTEVQGYIYMHYQNALFSILR